MDTEDCSRSPGVSCYGCHLPITDRYYYVISGDSWHVACLRCSQCNRTLHAELTCFSRHGKVYCKSDFVRYIAARGCASCALPIAPTDLVIKVKDNIYHAHCFVCNSCCRIISARQPFRLRLGHLFCERHAHLADSLVSPRLPRVTSEDEISGTAAKRSESPSTPARVPGPGAAEGGTTEEEHLLSSECERDLVGRSKSGLGVTSGLGLGLRDAGYDAREDMKLILARRIICSAVSGSNTSAGVIDMPEMTQYGMSHLMGTEESDVIKTRRRGRPKKIVKMTAETPEKKLSTESSTETEHEYKTPPVNRDGNPDEEIVGNRSPNSSPTSSVGRRKRQRSSFKQHQLRVMKAHFALNQNPDSKELKDIAAQTGLLARVIQVWFQNTRAKYRRSFASTRERYQTYDDVMTMCKGICDVTQHGAAAAQGLAAFHLGAGTMMDIADPGTSSQLNVFQRYDTGVI